MGKGHVKKNPKYPKVSEILKEEVSFVEYETDKGIVLLERFISMTGTKAFQDGKPAPDGRYKFGFWDYFEVTDGIITAS